MKYAFNFCCCFVCYRWMKKSDRVKGRTTFESRKGKSTELSSTCKDENEIVSYADRRTSLGLNLSKNTLWHNYVVSLTSVWGVPFKKGKPTEKWLTLFRKRHKNISLGKLEATTAVRHVSMTTERVGKHCDDLHNVLIANQLNPSGIWNMDECRLQLAHSFVLLHLHACLLFLHLLLVYKK